MTLVEILAGTLITSIVVSGTMTAFVTASRIQHVTASAVAVQASNSAQELMEFFRNRVAADDTVFQDKALQTASVGWIVDDGSLTGMPPAGVQRVYRVDGRDCDGDGQVASPGIAPLGPLEVDCYAVTVKVCWDQPSCP